MGQTHSSNAKRLLPIPGLRVASLFFVSRLSKVEAIEIHNLVPRSHEVTDKHLLRVSASVDFGNGAQLSV
jgi:hypothetical protein